MKTRIYGYLYDFWVYVIGQTENVQGITDGGVLHYGRLTCKTHGFSGRDSFAFPICDSSGMFYDVVSFYEEHGGTIFVKELIDEKSHYFHVPWRSEEEMNDIKRITIDSEYRDDMAKLLHFLVNQSPMKKIYIQIRRQSLGKDNIMGMLTPEQIETMMENDELLGNMVYVVCNAGKELS